VHDDRLRRGPARCEGCGILLGPGYLAGPGQPAPDGLGQVCGACRRSLEQATRRGEDALALLGRWRHDLRSGWAPR
jgi:hypothetical protein